jgi:hypothetical protein
MDALSVYLQKHQGELTSFRLSIQKRTDQESLACLLWYEWISAAQSLSTVDGHLIGNYQSYPHRMARHHSHCLLRIGTRRHHPDGKIQLAVKIQYLM